ncbi:hypothetical protein TBLA_0H02510 [Henningerozyma blattae CBS 6284]|uniref:SUN domain-containing protein n=1 Tax=Henningerozyma blattae (strain ATCC 34711 / CBS 6284 / DSM 70876 / NBRC 10599 / NRRL Y-10934 / UCD 77-7) TaxID=1071380 RepID=I2H833_HENB6|nr:hypothetical protein TBLA_0H02510 [Tetrapisispora blattae CBS 6284]CCH62535.1 hypothetical protein TBLA_0H02510 [Tetrapisispora blattae CBS 6284]
MQADESFIHDDELMSDEEYDDIYGSDYEYGSENDYENEYGDEYDDHYDIHSNINWFYTVVLSIIFSLIISYFMKNKNFTNVELDHTHIQEQINDITSKSHSMGTNYLHVFQENLQQIIDQFETQIKRIVPSKDTHELDQQLDMIDLQLQKFNRMVENEDITQFSEFLFEQLNTKLPNDVPVIISGNKQEYLIIPELYSYIAKILVSSFSNIRTSQPEVEEFHYDANNYSDEIITNSLRYKDKQQFLDDLAIKVSSIKQDIFNRLQENEYDLNKRLQLVEECIWKQYETNPFHWSDELNFITYSTGSQIINHLTSKTYSKGNSVPVTDLLLDNSPVAGNTNTYWQCSTSDHKGKCSLAVRFRSPVYLSKLFYIHGRFKNNVHLMNSAPRTISIYIRLSTQPALNTNSQDIIEIARQYGVGQTHPRDNGYFKLGTLNYDMLNPQLIQSFQIPLWFLRERVATHSILFQVEENYGCSDYTSLRAFVAHGFTGADLASTPIT